MRTDFRPGDLSPDSDQTVKVGAYRSAAAVTVTRPGKGHVLTVGEVATIEWAPSARSVPQSFAIELSTDNGSTWLPIADEVHSADRSHDWEVVDDPSTTCLIRVTGNRIAGGASGTSEVFTIAS